MSIQLVKHVELFSKGDLVNVYVLFAGEGRKNGVPWILSYLIIVFQGRKLTASISTRQGTLDLIQFSVMG